MSLSQNKKLEAQLLVATKKIAELELRLSKPVVERKRRQFELRPSTNNSMKRTSPSFAFHKNYTHPWSLFQKQCAVEYRKKNPIKKKTTIKPKPVLKRLTI